MWAIALQTLRECHRRPFPFVAAPLLALIALVSHLFQGFTFGAGQLEALNLATSGVFLAGFLHSALLGTALVRLDIERGTLAHVLTSPVGRTSYLGGRLAGLVASGLILCAAVGLLLAGVFLLPIGPPTQSLVGPPLIDACLRACGPVVVLEAAALAVSTIAGRMAAPLALFGVFVAASLAGDSMGGVLLPDFSLFGLSSDTSPSLVVLVPYTLVSAASFFVAGLLALTLLNPVRSQS